MFKDEPNLKATSREHYWWAKRMFFAEERVVEAAEKVAVSPQSNQEVSTNV